MKKEEGGAQSGSGGRLASGMRLLRTIWIRRILLQISKPFKELLMISRRSLGIVLTPVAALATGACATYPREAPPQVYYEVPCDMPGAFRADVRPADPNAAYSPGAAAPPASSSYPPASSSYPPAARPPSAQPLCLAQAEVVPRRYARRAYRYYNDYWWPYRGRSYFGFGMGFGHFGGGHLAGGHFGGGHHGGGHHGGGRRH